MTVEADRVFHALSDATRRDLLRHVILDGQQSVSALARRYPISLTAVQKHVGVLEKAQLISRERRGRMSVVHAEMSRVKFALSLLEQLEQIWRDRVDQMDAVLVEGDSPQEEGHDDGSS